MSVTIGRFVGAYKERVEENARQSLKSDRYLKLMQTTREVCLDFLLLAITFFSSWAKYILAYALLLH